MLGNALRSVFHHKTRRRRQRRVALALASLLNPSALAACVLALWRIGSDMEWTGAFAIPSGLFSHWQVWLMAAVALESCAVLLDRYGRSQGPAIP